MASSKAVEINLKGLGTAMHPAERAILNLKAGSLEVDSPAEASSVVTATANAIRNLLAPFCPQDETTGQTLAGGAIPHYSMSSLHTNQNRSYNNRGQTEPPTYSAHAEFHIKFADFAVLNQLATTFSSMDNVTISSIKWALTDATYDSLKSGTRKDAARDAIARARDYAEVFCEFPDAESVKVRPVSISEGSYNYNMSTKPQLHYGKMQRYTMKATETQELMFEPEDVRLEVHVDAVFVAEA